MVQIGDYVLLKEEERGPLGQMILAEHSILKRKVALKRLSFSFDKQFQEKLKDKIASLAALHHPHLAGLQNVCLQDEDCYFAYDWISASGEACLTLQECVEEKRIDEEGIKHVALQVASALDYIHASANMHLGVKASNVLVDTSRGFPTAYLTDVGLSSLFPPSVFLLGLLEECSKELGSGAGFSSFWESFYGLAPEQKEDRPLAQSDAYAFGVMLYKVLMGSFPQGYFLLPSQKGDFAYSWDRFLSLCLNPDPSKRPQNLFASLTEALSSSDTTGQEKILRPKVGPGEITRPQFELDPGAVFHVESAIMRYQPQALDETKKITPIDTKMTVIQGGSFFRGSGQGGRDESPRHQIILSPFALDAHPVTNEQFILFLETMGGEKDGNNNDMIRLKESRIKRSGGHFIIEAGYHKHPVVGVSWYGATAYAKWVGKRLPTEAEWEVAAAGGEKDPLYPTGHAIEKRQANFFSSDTTPVMSYPANGYGLYDMAGNVYEWCIDWYEYHYYDVSVQEPNNPKGPAQGVYRVLRGGGWKSLKEDMRCSYRHRNNPGTMNATYGFRCATDVFA